MILLQTVPRSIDLEKLEEELITVTRKDYEVRIHVDVCININKTLYDTIHSILYTNVMSGSSSTSSIIDLHIIWTILWLRIYAKLLVYSCQIRGYSQITHHM